MKKPTLEILIWFSSLFNTYEAKTWACQWKESLMLSCLNMWGVTSKGETQRISRLWWCGLQANQKAYCTKCGGNGPLFESIWGRGVLAS